MKSKRCKQCGIVHTPCPDCGGTIHVGSWPFCNGDPAKHQSVFRHQSSIEPVLIFRAADGRIRIPGSNSARTPRGYERVEIRDIQTLAKFDKGYREQLRRESSDLRAIHDEHFAAYQRQSRSELRQAMVHMNPFGRALAEYAMRKSDERERPRGEQFEAGFSVLNWNASERGVQRDQATNWRPRQV